MPLMNKALQEICKEKRKKHYTLCKALGSEIMNKNITKFLQLYSKYFHFPPGKLPTHPSPKLRFCLSDSVGLGKVWMGSFLMSDLIIFVPNQQKHPRRKTSCVQCFPSFIACGQALQSALEAGRQKEGELATTCLKFEYLP